MCLKWPHTRSILGKAVRISGLCLGQSWANSSYQGQAACAAGSGLFWRDRVGSLAKRIGITEQNINDWEMNIYEANHRWRSYMTGISRT